MSILESLKSIHAEAMDKLKAGRTAEELDQLRVSTLGKNGQLTAILRTMGKLLPEERAAVGAEANRIKQAFEAALESRRKELAAIAQQARFEAETLDVTAPGENKRPMGRLHPMTQTYREIRDALVGMGFSLFGGPEIELDDNNFTLLNLPKDHPARDMQDTFYVNENVVLRTHTSPCEIRALKGVQPPFRLVMPGRVFRVDEVDASHSPVFMQMEGFIMDRNLTLGDLKGTLDAFIRAVFGENVKTRLRPSYFPFTEPSAEMDMSCTICGGKGCRVCKGTGWIEVLGAGMVNPKVLEMCGIDPGKYTGFAFGIGIERITMLKYGVPNMKYLWENDVRFLKQFR